MEAARRTRTKRAGRGTSVDIVVAVRSRDLANATVTRHGQQTSNSTVKRGQARFCMSVWVRSGLRQSGNHRNPIDKSLDSQTAMVLVYVLVQNGHIVSCRGAATVY